MSNQAADSQKSAPNVENKDRVVLRFAGDSGDGIQLTGGQFTNATASLGNDLATLPDFPAEIRAPAGTLPGVSGFQISFSSYDIHTPGDTPDVLVAMNPAALKANIGDLPQGGTLIVNTDNFEKRNLEKAGYDQNPLEDGSLDGFRLFSIPLTTCTRNALKDTDLSTRDKDRCKNLFGLGMMFYLYQRPMDSTERWLEQKFASKQAILEANKIALKAGWSYCEATEVFPTVYRVPPAKLPAGTYRNVMGNQSLCLGLVAGSVQSKLPIFLGSYPITPASTILHELSRFKEFGVITFQAEDEIAAVTAAIGASYGGALGITSTSGPGLALKTEALGLAVMAELPLVVVNIQRGGPSTGLPTKTEQADLLQAIYGRNSEAPLPVIAAATPSDCFHVAFEACRIALEHMTPVILLSDGYLANGSEPWQLPDVSALPSIDPPKVEEAPADGFKPYSRNPKNLARPWAPPGVPGCEHRIGGLEKEDITGNVSYDPENHERMVRLRAAKVQRVADTYPKMEIDGPESGKVLVIGWGSSHGPIKGALAELHGDQCPVSHVHLRYVFPLPNDLKEIASRFDHIVVPEMNMGQLAMMMRSHLVREVHAITKVQGLPFKSSEIEQPIRQLLADGTIPSTETL